jgi:uncharacterized protein YggE
MESDMSHQKPYVFLGLIAALFASQIAISAELSGTPEELRRYLRTETRTVTIQDQASEFAYSDTAKITLMFSTEAKQLAEAMRLNNALRDQVIDRLVSSGVAADKIQSSKYSASPQFGWFGDKPTRFEVVNNIVVTVDSEEKFRFVAEMADSDEDIQFAGAKFEHSKKEETEDAVRDKALKLVMKNKRYFEKELGLKLTPVQFHFSDVYANQPKRDFAMVEEIMVTSQKLASSAPVQPPRAPSYDEIEYRVSVSVTFEIQPAE